MFCRRWRRLVGIAYRAGHAEGSAYAHGLETRIAVLEAAVGDPEAVARVFSEMTAWENAELRHRRPDPA